MKPFRTILIISCFIPCFVFGQEVGKWRAGSAYKLAGKVYVVTCFVSGPDDQWSPGEKQNMLIKMHDATQWLITQAAKYKVSVFFDGQSFGLTNDIKLPEIKRGTASGTEPVDLVSVVLAKVGFPTPPDVYKSLTGKYDNLQVIIFIKGQGNGYSMAFNPGMDENLYFVEGSVLYEKYWDNQQTASSSIAHEMLHQYGAWDLYKTFKQTQENEDKARQMFPDSIMLRYFADINDAEVDEVTAWLIGWNTAPKPWYDTFRAPGD